MRRWLEANPNDELAQEVRARLTSEPATYAAYDATELHEDSLATLAMLQERWAVERREMHLYLDGLTEASLNGTVRYVIPGAQRERVVWHVLVDLIFHAAQHRSEAAALLTSFGHPPGDLDFIEFMNQPSEAGS